MESLVQSRSVDVDEAYRSSGTLYQNLLVLTVVGDVLQIEIKSESISQKS
jgi:hypothetical protein